MPLRLEIGPKDMEAGPVRAGAPRQPREAVHVKLDDLETRHPRSCWRPLAKALYDRALENRENRTFTATTMDEVNGAWPGPRRGFIKTMWCGDRGLRGSR